MKKYLSCFLGLLFLGLLVNPVFGEVTNLHTNNDSFLMGDKIEFSGTVEKKSKGLVTIVIRDLNNEFVLLTQATINHDDTFEKSIQIKKKFTQNGIYNATGFILNMTRGVTSEFSVSLDENKMIDEVTLEKIEDNVIENTQNVIQENEQYVPLENVKIINSDFVDSNIEPSYYVKRYYSEPAYKSWFDRNYPGQVIEETVGYTDNVEKIKSAVNDIMDNTIVPEAQASSIVTSNYNNNDDSDIAHITLVLAALGILFGAVYGVKIQVDNNSRQISINRDSIRIPKIIHHKFDPKEILEARLAKGKITLEEYEKLKSKLD